MKFCVRESTDNFNLKIPLKVTGMTQSDEDRLFVLIKLKYIIQ